MAIKGGSKIGMSKSEVSLELTSRSPAERTIDMRHNPARRVIVNSDARILIVSDLHLPQRPTEESRQRVKKLGGLFSAEASGISHVVLLGDIFEFWFEYPYLAPKGYHGLLWELRKLTESGKVVVFFPGNHDYWLGDFFHREIGVRVADELEVWVLGKRSIALTHGDGCDPEDKGYHLLKRILRARMAIKAFQLIHPELAFAIARFVSKLSRDAATKKREWSNSRFLSFAISMLEQDIDAVIVGHSHTAQMVDLETGLLVNTGNWLRNPTYCIVSEEETEVRLWPSEDPLPLQPKSEIENPPLGTT